MTIDFGDKGKFSTAVVTKVAVSAIIHPSLGAFTATSLSVRPLAAPGSCGIQTKRGNLWRLHCII